MKLNHHTHTAGLWGAPTQLCRKNILLLCVHFVLCIACTFIWIKKPSPVKKNRSVVRVRANHKSVARVRANHRSVPRVGANHRSVPRVRANHRSVPRVRANHRCQCSRVHLSLTVVTFTVDTVGFIPARVLISTRVRHRVCRDCDVSTAYLSTEYYIPLLHWSEFICCPIILPVGPCKQLITSIE